MSAVQAIGGAGAPAGGWTSRPVAASIDLAGGPRRVSRDPVAEALPVSPTHVTEALR
ncbi:hypothetical protein ABZT47_27250 [Sphaerisporangium sp. NPDC005289]|uniref:hypothetical protein n=1 Tax=Sphaerisporangium sp. NPDC005289 TaxID=3155247 RepID=UPI0033B360E6